MLKILRYRDEWALSHMAHLYVLMVVWVVLQVLWPASPSASWWSSCWQWRLFVLRLLLLVSSSWLVCCLCWRCKWLTMFLTLWLHEFPTNYTLPLICMRFVLYSRWTGESYRAASICNSVRWLLSLHKITPHHWTHPQKILVFCNLVQRLLAHFIPPIRIVLGSTEEDLSLYEWKFSFFRIACVVLLGTLMLALARLRNFEDFRCYLPFS
jgi:hypothetical protein